MKYNSKAFHEIWESLIQHIDDREQGTLNSRPVSSRTTFSLDELEKMWPPLRLEPNQALAWFNKNLAPYLSMSNGPRYFGFVTGGVTPAGLMGDMLTSLWDQNVMCHGDSIAPKIEQFTIKKLIEFFSLPASFKGIFTTGATAANIVSLALARQILAERLSFDVAEYGLNALPNIRILSALPHASIAKAASILGLGRQSVKLIPTSHSSAMIDCVALERTLAQNRDSMTIVVASAGEVNTAAFDPIDKIADLCHHYGAWLHVDAAFGLFARVSSKHKIYTQGIENADSITTDLHKWMNVPYDCGLMLSKHGHHLPKIFHSQAAYLPETNANAFDNQHPMNCGIENSRRFRALPVLMNLLCYGKKSYRQMITRHCHLALTLSDYLRRSTHYQLLHPTLLNVVIFRVKNGGTSTQELLSKLNASGSVFVTPSSFQGTMAIRVAICNWRTKKEDIERLIVLLTAIDKNMKKHDRSMTGL